ncbi:MAG: hypothetical protein QXD68_04090, partial [Thermoplasmatales archaeon]
MNYDDFISLMADHNQRLYPNHNNMWKKIHLLDSDNLSPRTNKIFKSFKSRLSKTLQNFSKADIEKLLTTKNGPRPHANTFILKKLGISAKMYKTIRYSVFNHTRHAKGNNPDDFVPIINENMPQAEGFCETKEISTGIDTNKQIPEMQLQQFQGQEEMFDDLKNDLILYLEGFVDERIDALRYEFHKEIRDRIQGQISKEMKNIQVQSSENIFLSTLMGGGAGAVVTKIIDMFAQRSKDDIEKRINEVSQKIQQLDQALQEQSKNIQMIFEWIKFISNISDGFNYLRIFGVPITREDWDSLPDELKRTWSPVHIKPPMSQGMKNAIAKAIKAKLPPSVD